MKTRFLVTLLLLVFLANAVWASHIMGGELTWECQSNGQLVFTMKLYRDCNGVTGALFNAQTITSNSPLGNFLVYFSDTNDISPVCANTPSEPHIFCASAAGFDTGAVEEYIYHSNPLTLSGVPPAGGWTFSWSDCCRNAAIVNISTAGYSVRARMYPYNGRNMYPCYDSSPQFYERPAPVICNGYPSTFNQNAADNDLDSLSYEWAQSLDDSGNPCTYVTGYTFDNPLPDSTEDNRNHRALVNALNGEIHFTSFTGGTFVVCTKTTAWKCGIRVAEVFRDMQIILKTCRPLIPSTFPPTYNHMPSVSAPFIDPLGNPAFVDTFYAGDTVHFQVSMTDFDIDPIGNFQILHMEPSGTQFSSNYSDTSACLHPPCATLTPDPLATSGNAVLNFTFNWFTSCDHAILDTACQAVAAVHNFAFKALDDFCPVPGMNLFTVSIVVLPPRGWPLHIIVSNDTLFCSVQSASFQWYRNDTAIIGANSSFYVPVISGNYAVEATMNGGCMATSPAVSFTPVGTFAPEFAWEINLSPNPFVHSVQLTAQGRKPTPVYVHLADALGKILTTWEYGAEMNSLHESYDLSSLAAGIYFLQFESNDSQKTFRLVKMD